MTMDIMSITIGVIIAEFACRAITFYLARLHFYLMARHKRKLDKKAAKIAIDHAAAQAWPAPIYMYQHERPKHGPA